MSSAMPSSTQHPSDVHPHRGSGRGQASVTPVPVFGGAPIVPIPTGMATGVSLFQSSVAPPLGFYTLASELGVASTLLAPAAASMP